MEKIVRILHLEDNPTDGELIRNYLENAGIACEVHRVDNERDFVGALEVSEYDLVISDFSMPGYNGNEAMKYVHGNYPATPFLFVSGTLGEDYAIDSLLNGATDYVLKTKMGRLVPAVTRAIAERQERLKRSNAERAVRERDERFRAVLENSLDGMAVFNSEGEVILRSPANARILGQQNYSSERGNIFDGVHPDDAPAIRSMLDELVQKDRMQGTMIFRHKHGDGSWRRLEATFSNMLSDPTVNGIVVNFRDVTEKLEAEAIIRQTQKMESLGTLAGGIAHDFNNILAIILGYSSYIARHRVDEAKLAQSIEAIHGAAERGAGLVRQLLMFARKQEFELTSINVNDVVRGVYKLVSETFPKLLSTSIELNENLPTIIGDQVQLNQCLLNLCVNARDAMMDRNDGKPAGGLLKVSSGIADADMLARHPEAKKDCQYIALSVSDTGVGIPEAYLPKIFEPFFTTKETGKGTGIGLSTVFGVMKKHGGFVDVQTKTRVGTTFTLCFPAEGKGNAMFETHANEGAKGGHGETIIVAEGEEVLGELLKDALGDKGYKVLTAENGPEVFALLSRNPDVALVFSALELPEMDGLEVLRRTKEAYPGIKVILASGSVDEGTEETIKGSPADGVLQKPFKMSDALRAVRQVLDRESRSGGS